MLAREFIIENLQVYYHGSYDNLPVGTILTARDDYENRWGNTDFYQILEMYRPKHMLSHRESVFMCDNPDDVSIAGGATDYLFTLRALGPVERHDLNWSSEISNLLSQDYEWDSDEIMEAAQYYWQGTPYTEIYDGESVWEYLTRRAKILKVEEY